MTVLCWAILKHGMQNFLWCQLELGTVELFSAIINNYKYIWFQSPDGHYIACGAIDGIINIFDLTTGKLLHTLEGDKWKIYVRKKFMQAYFFDFFVSSAGHAMPIRSLTFSPDSQLLITASDDNHIKMYDVYHLGHCHSVSWWFLCVILFLGLYCWNLQETIEGVHGIKP